MNNYIICAVILIFTMLLCSFVFVCSFFYKPGRSIAILLCSFTQRTIAQQQWAQKSYTIYEQPENYTILAK